LKFALPPELIEVYKGFGNDLALINGEPSWTLPMPGRFVIGTDGTIRYAEVNPDYTKRPEPSALLPALRAANLATTSAPPSRRSRGGLSQALMVSPSNHKPAEARQAHLSTSSG